MHKYIRKSKTKLSQIMKYVLMGILQKRKKFNEEFIFH
ncbi:hypothetical protein CAMRE0001_1480 [Campylobacter rectus RM3267]|uniref:Uncharacterized protein n=1 Tax=Campylobacter rectus RM3267 TaxID=553218 RepID=B9D345_CAMRE|nr:hypothetical protein CAMRE0001_1480 [Campylobacter rectus RM3267]